jgi:hypothetical protein
MLKIVRRKDCDTISHAVRMSTTDITQPNLTLPNN